MGASRSTQPAARHASSCMQPAAAAAANSSSSMHVPSATCRLKRAEQRLSAGLSLVSAARSPQPAARAAMRRWDERRLLSPTQEARGLLPSFVHATVLFSHEAIPVVGHMPAGWKSKHAPALKSTKCSQASSPSRRLSRMRPAPTLLPPRMLPLMSVFEVPQGGGAENPALTQASASHSVVHVILFRVGRIALSWQRRVASTAGDIEKGRTVFFTACCAVLSCPPPQLVRACHMLGV